MEMDLSWNHIVIGFGFLTLEYTLTTIEIVVEINANYLCSHMLHALDIVFKQPILFLYF